MLRGWAVRVTTPNCCHPLSRRCQGLLLDAPPPAAACRLRPRCAAIQRHCALLFSPLLALVRRPPFAGSGRLPTSADCSWLGVEPQGVGAPDAATEAWLVVGGRGDGMVVGPWWMLRLPPMADVRAPAKPSPMPVVVQLWRMTPEASP